jgi:Kef-type K+ transport system membrane component KefB
MRRLLALVITIVIVWVVVSSEAAAAMGARPTALALGFALIAAALTGTLFERIRLPRVSGYLVFGLLCGPYLANIITRPMARDLQVVNGLAIALIALIAGLELNYRRLRPRIGAMAKLGALTLVFMYAFLLPPIWLAWPWLPIVPEATGLARFALAVLLTTVVVSFSPTVTIAVIADTRSRGPLSELVLAVVVLADLVLILGFTLSMQLVRWATTEGSGGDVGLLARMSWDIFGSFAFGAAIGAAFALYLRYVGREVTVVLLGVCLLLSEIGSRLHFEPLLASLAAGLVVENIAPPSGDSLKDAVERGALPVLIVFFAAAGASLHLDALAAIGIVAAIIALLRLAAIRVSAGLAVPLSGVARESGNRMWMGLVSQAGVTLGLTILVANEFDWGVRVQALMVALIAMHELIGPVLFRAGLAAAGEIGKMDEAEIVKG